MRFSVRVCLAFSWAAAVRRSGGGDFLRPFADAFLPFVDSATFDSSRAVGQHHLRLRPFCRCAFSLRFRPFLPCSLDFRSSACFRFLLRFLLLLSYLLLRPVHYLPSL